MTAQDAERVLKCGLQVTIVWPTTPKAPYVGRITDALGNGWFLFVGRSGTEIFSGTVRPEEVSLWNS